MPAADFEKLSNGRYKTDGLDDKAFERVFNLINKKQRNTRRNARRTLTPAMMKNKDLDKILALGKKSDGTLITPEDLKTFSESRRAHRKSFKHDVAGITYNQLVAQSRKIDIDRANDNVSDGTGIKKATPIGIKHNIISIKVRASEGSDDQNHRVKVRFEEWDTAVEEIDPEKKAQNARVTRSLCAGRVSFDCDCGRHQYWYRYMATAGNYALKPPAEYAYPKKRNPDLTGVACKHVLHAMTRLQAASWQVAIMKELLKASTAVQFGDDARKTAKYFSEDEAKALARNRASTTNQKKAKEAFKRYQAAQDGMAKKQAKSKDVIDAMRQKLTKARTSSQKKTLELKIERAKTADLQQQLAAQKDLLEKQISAKKDVFMQSMQAAGIDGQKAEAAFKNWLKTQMGKAK